jgi:hypothetical protein
MRPLKEETMFKKSLSLALAGALIFTLVGAAPVAAKSKAEKETERAAKVKAGVAKLDVSKDARIAVRLRDKTRVSGYISQADEHSFVITDIKTGAATEIPYPEVTQAKGQNLSTGAKIAIGIAIGVGVAALIFLLRIYYGD